MPTTTITYACVATGSLKGQANSSVDRLYRMLCQFSPRPFKLVCITDQRRTINSEIVQIDASQWNEFKNSGVHATYGKLSLFNPEYMPYADVIYMDLSVIIQAPLAPLIQFAKDAPDDLVIVKDWGDSEINSSVMRIRNRNLRFVHESFLRGRKYPEKVPGDQDFIAGAMHAHQKPLALFPDEFVVSFKKIMRQGCSDWNTAHELATNAMIVKFHGNPKPEKVFSRGYIPRRYGLRYWLRGRTKYPFDFENLKRHWYAAPPHPARN